MGLLKVFGSILIVAAIASSSYFHLESPEESVQEFQSNYATLDSLAQQYLKYDIPLDQVLLPQCRLTGKLQSKYLESSNY